MIKWPVKLYVRFYVLLTFLKSKIMTFRVFEWLHTFSRTLETCNVS